MWRIGFASGQSHVWEFGRGLARPFRHAGRLPVPEAVALSRRDASSRVTHGQAITGETAVKALAALLAILMGPLSTAQATAASPNAGVTTGVIPPPMPVALTQALTFTYRFNPSRRIILEPTEAGRHPGAACMTKHTCPGGQRSEAA